jgi:hypothetical protein
MVIISGSSVVPDRRVARQDLLEEGRPRRHADNEDRAVHRAAVPARGEELREKPPQVAGPRRVLVRV